MRLIDADAYAAEMRKRQDACRKWKSEQNKGSEMYARAEQAFVTFVEAWVTLENQPTIAAITVEWMKDKMQKPQTTCMNPFGFVLAEWLEEQEAQDG